MLLIATSQEVPPSSLTRTYLYPIRRLFGGVQALPVTPSQGNLVAQHLFIAFDRV